MSSAQTSGVAVQGLSSLQVGCCSLQSEPLQALKHVCVLACSAEGMCSAQILKLLNFISHAVSLRSQTAVAAARSHQPAVVVAAAAACMCVFWCAQQKGCAQQDVYNDFHLEGSMVLSAFEHQYK
jgi:hypothetical protein